MKAGNTASEVYNHGDGVGVGTGTNTLSGGDTTVYWDSNILIISRVIFKENLRAAASITPNNRSASIEV